MTQSRDTFSEDDIRGYFDYLQRWILCDTQAVGLAAQETTLKDSDHQLLASGQLVEPGQLNDNQKNIVSKITEPHILDIVKGSAKNFLDNAKNLIGQDTRLKEIFTPYYAYVEDPLERKYVTDDQITALRNKVDNYTDLQKKRKDWKAYQILSEGIVLDAKLSGGYLGAGREQAEDDAVNHFKMRMEEQERKGEPREAYQEWMYRLSMLVFQFQTVTAAIPSIKILAENPKEDVPEDKKEKQRMLVTSKISELIIGLRNLNTCIDQEKDARKNYLLEQESNLTVAEEKDVADDDFLKPLQNDLTIEGRPLVLDTETELQQLKDKIATKLIGLSLYTQRKETKAMLAEDKLTNGNIAQQIRRGKETEARFLLSLYNDAKREGITSAELERLENEFNAPEKFAKKNIFQKAWSWVKANPKIVAGAIVTGVIVTGLTVATMGAFGVIGAGVAGGAAIGANMATLTAVGGGFSSIGVGMGAVGTVATAAIGAAASFTGGVLLAFAAIGLGKGIKAATRASRDKASSPVVKNASVVAEEKSTGFIVGRLKKARVSPEAPGAGTAPVAANAPEVAASASSNAPVAGVEAPAASSASEAAASEVSDVVAEAVSTSPRMGSRH